MKNRLIQDTIEKLSVLIALRENSEGSYYYYYFYYTNNTFKYKKTKKEKSVN